MVMRDHLNSSLILVPLSSSKFIFRVATGLSIVGCIGVFIIAHFFDFHKTPLKRAILLISFGDLLFGLANFILSFIPNPSQKICDIWTSIGYFGLLTSTTWAVYFAYISKILVEYGAQRQESPNIRQESLIPSLRRHPKVPFKRYLLILTLLTFSITVVFFFSPYDQSRTNTDGEIICCHVVKSGAFDFWYFFMIFLETIICFFFIFWFWLRTISILREMHGNRIRKTFIRILLYPGIVVVCWTLHLVVFWIMILDENENVPPSLIWTAEAICKGQGFANALVYALNPKVIEGLKNLYRRKINNQIETTEHVQISDHNIRSSYVV